MYYNQYAHGVRSGFIMFVCPAGQLYSETSEYKNFFEFGDMKKAVTIKEIAEQLNLSRNTVAKALNGQYVPEKTRELVLKKAQEMNYKSLNLKRIEVGEHKYRILLVSGKPLNNMDYFVPIVSGIENYCFEKNYEFFQHTYNVSRTPFSGLADYVKEVRPDGIVAIECFDKNFILRLLNLDKPICFVDFTAYDMPLDKRCDIISTNDEKSVCDIVKLLISRHGASSFTFVGDRRHCLSFHERYMGMLKGIISLKSEHTKKDDILCSDESFDYGSADAIKTEILKLKYRPDCFICCNDFVARNVCDALKSLNVRVPEDAMVVGFDNVSEATALKPGITTFSVDKDFLGRETMRTLVHRIENPRTPSRTITISTDTILRESTGRLPRE